MADEAALGSSAGTGAAPAPAAPAAAAPPPSTDSNTFDAWAQANAAMLDNPSAKEPAAPAAPGADTPPETAPDKPEGADTPADKPAADETPDETKPDEAAAQDAPVVAFVEDEPFDAFAEKVEKFFDAYDVDPSIVAMKDGFEKRIQALQTQIDGQVEVNDGIKATVEAVAAIDEFRKDEASGVLVPKTNEIVAMVQATKSPTVFKQLVFDAVNAPSEKYKHLGFNMLHELYIDAGVPPQRMDEFISYVSGEAVLPSLHPDLPEGVPVELAEAYGTNSALRKVIEDSIDTLGWSDEDKRLYPEQYREAKATFDDALDALQAKQKALDGDRNEKVAVREREIKAKAAFQQTVTADTQQIQKAELGSFGKDLDEKLAIFIPDAAARSLQVTSYKQLIVNALADDIYGADARADLKAQGINIEFAKAQTLFQSIQDAAAQRLIIFQQTGDRNAADKAVEKQLTNALRELGVMRRNVIGKVAQVVTKSYTNGSLKPAGDKPQLRPTLKGGYGAEGSKGQARSVNFQDPTEAGKWYRDNLFGGDGAN